MIMSFNKHAMVLSSLVGLLRSEYEDKDFSLDSKICISHYLNWIKMTAEDNDLPLEDIGLAGYTIPDPLMEMQDELK